METIEDIINQIDKFPNEANEKIRTARSALRSKFIELASRVDNNKHPQTEITEGIRELTNLNANWVKADMEVVYRTHTIPTKKIEEQNKYLEVGISAEDSE